MANVLRFAKINDLLSHVGGMVGDAFEAHRRGEAGGRALVERGRAYFGLGRFAEAADDWSKCAALSPSRASELAPLIAEAKSKGRK